MTDLIDSRPDNSRPDDYRPDEADLRDPAQVVRHLRLMVELESFSGRTLLPVVCHRDGIPAVHCPVDEFPRDLAAASCDRWLWPFVTAAEGAALLVALVEDDCPTPAPEVRELAAAARRGCEAHDVQLLGVWLVAGTTVVAVDG